jgi:adenylate kinase family enzyme
MTPQSFIFIGRYGAGKGTQSKLLIEALAKADPSRKTMYIETGGEFRKFMAGEGYSQGIARKIITSGALMPVFMCVYMWGHRLAEEFTGNEHLVFDGTPRKLLEAQLLEPVFPFYGLEAPWVIYLDIHHDEAHTRLKLRSRSSGRIDDGDAEIRRRKDAFEADVLPTVEWYRSHSGVRFVEIDGIGPIEKIHADIIAKIGLK